MKIYLTEEQMARILNEQLLMESLFRKGMSFQEIISTVKKLAMRGVVTASLIANIVMFYGLNRMQKATLEKVAQVEETVKSQDWRLIADDVLATVYNAVPAQCNNDVRHTASMYTLNLDDVLSDRVIAMERTMMKVYGLKYGDIVKIEGTEKWDGLWQIQDTMNKRFAGQHKIDILVPNNIRLGKWSNVKVYIPGDEETAEFAKENLKTNPQV